MNIWVTGPENYRKPYRTSTLEHRRPGAGLLSLRDCEKML
jgi:hypothetical protein